MYELYFRLLKYSCYIIILALASNFVKTLTIYFSLRSDIIDKDFYVFESKFEIFLGMFYLPETGLNNDRYLRFVNLFYLLMNLTIYAAFTVFMVKMEHHVEDIYYSRKNSEIALFTLQ